jgi:hypothetical protein
VRWLVFDAEALAHLDSTGARALGDLIRSLRADGIVFVFARVKTPMRRRLEAAGIVGLVGPDHSTPPSAPPSRRRQALERTRNEQHPTSFSGPGSTRPAPELDAGRLWTGGLATAAVAAPTLLAGTLPPLGFQADTEPHKHTAVNQSSAFFTVGRRTPLSTLAPPGASTWPAGNSMPVIGASDFPGRHPATASGPARARPSVLALLPG